MPRRRSRHWHRSYQLAPSILTACVPVVSASRPSLNADREYAVSNTECTAAHNAHIHHHRTMSTCRACLEIPHTVPEQWRDARGYTQHVLQPPASWAFSCCFSSKPTRSDQLSTLCSRFPTASSSFVLPSRTQSSQGRFVCSSNQPPHCPQIARQLSSCLCSLRDDVHSPSCQFYVYSLLSV